MTPEELEFRISQYLDGTLPAPERADLDKLLQTDPAAQQLLADYRKLDQGLVRFHAMPAVNWDRFAEHLSAVVGQSDSRVIAGRIGASGFSWSSRLAIAASIAIAVLAGSLIYRAHRPMAQSKQLATSQLLIQGPQVEVAHASPIEEISIGPSPALASSGQSWRYAQAVVAQPSRAVILTDLH